MSELITYPKSYVYDQLGNKPRGNLYYLKYDVDAVIAKLEKELNNSRNARKYWRKEYLIEYKECCSQKYKRCLAMAKLCENEEKRLEAIAPIFDTDKECWEYASDYWVKWRQRWLKIAEQFKEAK